MGRREWIRLDLGLLDDERWTKLSLEDRGVWTTIYLLIAHDGDKVKSHHRLAWLLDKAGISGAEALVDRLRAAGWFVRADGGGITLRGYDKYQLKWVRGPSDSPEEKALRNARRPTTREGRERGATVERRGATAKGASSREPESARANSLHNNQQQVRTRRATRGGATVERGGATHSTVQYIQKRADANAPGGAHPRTGASKVQPLSEIIGPFEDVIAGKRKEATPKKSRKKSTSSGT